MNNKELIEVIQNTLEKSRKTENPFISIDALQKYLESLKGYADKKSDYDDKIHQRDLKVLENRNAADIEMFRSVIESGKDALRAVLIVNGGAILAILALLGNLGDRLIPLLDKGLISALCMFSWGIFLGTIIYGIRYFAQAYYSEEKVKIGNFCTAVCVCLAILSYVSLGFGLFQTFLAFNSLMT